MLNFLTNPSNCQGVVNSRCGWTVVQVLQGYWCAAGMFGTEDSEEIAELFSDLLGPLLLELLPLCEVLQEIPLIDESKQLKHSFPKCPEAFHPELA